MMKDTIDSFVFLNCVKSIHWNNKRWNKKSKSTNDKLLKAANDLMGSMAHPWFLEVLIWFE